MTNTEYPDALERLMPNIFTVETILGCDLSCPECALGGGFVKRKKGRMNFEQFKLIAEKIKPFCEYLYLHIWGEPILNDDIYKIIKYASTFTRTNISTNGNQITMEKAEHLILSGVTDIIVSIDGVSKEVYEKYRVGGSVDKAVDALKMLQEFKIKHGSCTNIVPQFIVFKHNQHEMEAFQELCRSIGLKPAYKAPYLRNQKSRYSLSDYPQFVRPIFQKISKLKTAMTECPNVKNVFTILRDGSVVICCHDYGKITCFGNIFEQSVEEIWNSHLFKKTRWNISSGNPPNFCLNNCMTWFLNQAENHPYFSCDADMMGESEKDLTLSHDNSIDTFVCNTAIKHISNTRKQKILNEDSCAIKPGGMQKFGKHIKFKTKLSGFEGNLNLAREKINSGDFFESIDIYAQLYVAHSDQAVKILSELYDLYQKIPNKDRYHLYQARQINFNINASDKVIDIGSGHIPFPLATHLADITLDDHGYGRALTPFKHLKGKPVYECNIENMPFDNKEFDFIYCSHVLEHAEHPEKACREIMRVAKRGYIETPTKGKDIFLNSNKISNHNFWIEAINGKLIFTEYTPDEIEGLQCSILMSMHTSPQTEREKAFSALIYLKPQLFNTMFLWEEKFDFEIRKPVKSEQQELVASSISEFCINTEKQSPTVSQSAGMARSVNPHFKQSNVLQTMNVGVADIDNPTVGWSELPDLNQKNATTTAPIQLEITSLKFLQIHTFYAQYLKDFYLKESSLATASYKDQIEALYSDGFSAIHIFAPYMNALSYESQLIVANNPYSQQQWLRENNVEFRSNNNRMLQVVREQIDRIKPEVLYLTDPITFESEFIRSLSWKPKLVLGWRAANIPAGIDWSEFDVILSSLTGIRNMALKLGAKSVEHFFPGFPEWMNDSVKDTNPDFDVVFSGTWSSNQHPQRNRYLKAIADEAAQGRPAFTCGFYINAPNENLPTDVSNYNLGPRFGVAMHQALHSGRIVIDGRGTLELINPSSTQNIDLAEKQTANMRLFEATGNGSFLLTEHYDNLQDYFQPGVEIETFKDKKELIEKIYYYLDNPEKRKAIARRGHERCLSEYSMGKRAVEFDRIIQKHLKFKNIARSSHENSTVQIKTQAEKLIQNEDYSAAFQLIIKAKSLKVPTYGLDLLRAICFLHMNNHGNALEALREELRLFPTNREAKLLFDRLSVINQRSENLINDSKFNHILKIIKPYTLLSNQRLYSLYNHARRVCDADLPGNFVECGVAAGGSTALLAYVIKTKSRQPRKIYAFDSFEGMPKPTDEDTHQGIPAEKTGWGSGTCFAAEESVLEICNALNVSDIVEPVKGYFQETLPYARNQIGPVALLHMDGDWYDSTRVILANLYDNVIANGFIQVDDYGHWEGCKKAIKEFEASRNIRFKISAIDGTGVWFEKPEL